MMSRELGGVVDGRLRVYGTKNLRVVDASAMPMQISAHLSATLYGFAEKVSCVADTEQTSCLILVLLYRQLILSRTIFEVFFIILYSTSVFCYRKTLFLIGCLPVRALNGSRENLKASAPIHHPGLMYSIQVFCTMR
jgi:hypothetical protein